MSMTMEDVAKQLAEAKERGIWEGRVMEKLDSLNQAMTAMNTYNAELRGMLQAQGTTISETRAAVNTLREDREEDRERIKRVETSVDETIKKFNDRLDALNDRLDGFGNMFMRYALASVGGGGVSAATVIGLLKGLGLLH